MAIKSISSISQAIQLLKQGELVVYPTETAYALGVDALNTKAIQKIYDIKSRDSKKPLAVIVGNLEQAKKYFKFNDTALNFAKKYWPGPVTLILPYKNNKLKALNPAGDTIGVRVSSHKTAQKLAIGLGNPIVSTSANISGQSTAYSKSAIYKQLDKLSQTIYFLDAGTLARRATSAMIEIKDDTIKIYRSNPVLNND